MNIRRINLLKVWINSNNRYIWACCLITLMQNSPGMLALIGGADFIVLVQNPQKEILAAFAQLITDTVSNLIKSKETTYRFGLVFFKKTKKTDSPSIKKPIPFPENNLHNEKTTLVIT